MEQWFAGGVLTLEMQRHIQNFLTVVQARLEQTEGDDAHDDDVYEDAELQIGLEGLDELLATSKRRDVEPDDAGEAKEDPNYALLVEAMNLGRSIWKKHEEPMKLREPVGDSKTPREQADAMIKAEKSVTKTWVGPRHVSVRSSRMQMKCGLGCT